MLAENSLQIPDVAYPAPVDGVEALGIDEDVILAKASGSGTTIEVIGSRTDHFESILEVRTLGLSFPRSYSHTLV